jgi:hypothetical protein
VCPIAPVPVPVANSTTTTTAKTARMHAYNPASGGNDHGRRNPRFPIINAATTFGHRRATGRAGSIMPLSEC